MALESQNLLGFSTMACFTIQLDGSHYFDKPKMKRTVYLTLAFAITAIFATLSQAQTNSYISSVNGFWQDSNSWSLATAPFISQSAILITNTASEMVTIDSTTANNFSSTLTISNLAVSAPSGSANTLYLDNTGTIALHILDNLSIGIITFPPTGGGILISTNSTLIVDGLMGGQLVDDGTIVIAEGSLITTNCNLQIASDPNSFFPPTGLLILSNAVVQARDVSLGVTSISGSSGTIEIIDGAMTVSSSLTLGLFEESGGGIGNLLVANGGLLVVTNGETGVIHGSITVDNADFLAGDVFVSGLGAEVTINNGTVTLDGELNIGTGDRSFGSVFLNGGKLVVTNNITDIGGFPGIGQLNVAGGLYLGQEVFLLESTLQIQGGVSILSSNLGIGFGASVSIGGGQLFVTNAPISIFGGISQCIVTGGQLAASIIELSPYGGGTLTVDGGSVTASTGITIGNCASNVFGYVTVGGGQLIVTNTAGTGFINVQNGQLVFTNGVLQMDKLVMTNSCGSFIHTGGSLIIGSVVLDPNAFAITSIAREGNDLRVTWMMGPGQTNALQVSSGGIHGTYTTNGFTDIFIVTNNPTAGTLTNYLDIGAATNKPSRYYRARLAP
jgi:hypothetical protein